MTVPYDPVFDAIRSFLGYTDVTQSPPVVVPGAWDTSIAPLDYENEGDSAPAGNPAAWVHVEITSTLYGQESIGANQQRDNRWDEEGQLWFHVFVPRGSGSREARRIAKGLANLCRGQTLIGGSLEFLDASMSSGDSGRENANYFLMSVNVEWRFMDAS